MSPSTIPINVTVVGTGYVGLSTAAMLAYLGHRITGLDVDAGKIDLLRRGQVPIYEPGLEALLAAARNNLTWTTDYQEAVPGADIIMICVGTPLSEDGGVDLGYIRAATTEVARHLNGRGPVVVNKSTVPMGTGGWVARILADNSPAGEGQGCAVLSNPEFLREGSALRDSFYPDRIVLGSDSPTALERMKQLYAPLLNQDFTSPHHTPRPEGYGQPALVTTTLTSAEMIKYAANAFLAMKISYINEIAGLCQRVGADVLEVAKGIGYDQRIGNRFLSAGAGWGGSCFGKDIEALRCTGSEYHYTMPLLDATVEVNQRQREDVISRLQQHLKRIKGRRISVLGMAFKPNTDDLRDAPAHDFIQKLGALGAFVTAHDPIAMPRARREWKHLTYQEAATAEAAFIGADALVVATEWPEYQELDWERLVGTMANPLVVDARNIVRTPLNASAQVEQIGR
ncbi:MAG TPA: UDP-glucose/GDP-mannose dehydrogenase family protein [Armatimonadota bacterium]|jgi:UDPglucose 6-dehydrogenase